MRQILTARDVEEMIRRGATVREVPVDAIITPAAQDLLPMLRRVPVAAPAPAAVAVPAGPSLADLLRRIEGLETELRAMRAAQAAKVVVAPPAVAPQADVCGTCARGDDAQWRPGATCAPAAKSGGCGCGGSCGCGGKCGCGGAPVVERNEVAEAMVRQITEMIMKSL